MNMRLFVVVVATYLPKMKASGTRTPNDAHIKSPWSWYQWVGSETTTFISPVSKLIDIAPLQLRECKRYWHTNTFNDLHHGDFFSWSDPPSFFVPHPFMHNVPFIQGIMSIQPHDSSMISSSPMCQKVILQLARRARCVCPHKICLSTKSTSIHQLRPTHCCQIGHKSVKQQRTMHEYDANMRTRDRQGHIPIWELLWTTKRDLKSTSLHCLTYSLIMSSHILVAHFMFRPHGNLRP